jgi:1-acyl-sn-glycerol-3-phosphate acyltransferase
VLFTILKGYARLTIKIYCRKIIVNQPEWLGVKGPLLLACNHPNSFLDGIIVTTIFEENIYSLARGDAFKKPWHEKVLRRLHLLPVYRTSEGVENLEHNYTTFDACKAVFRQNGIVIIFSEGRCINEWHLRPLKKGTARLATSSWEDGIPLTVLPVGLNYNTFRNFGKNVFLNFGHPLDRDEVMRHQTDGRMFLTFNEQLNAELQTLVYEIDRCDHRALKEKVSVPLPYWKRVALLLPAFAGFLLHAPFYFAAKAITKTYFDNDHFDSSLVGMLVLAYPFYLLLWYMVAGMALNWVVALAVFLLLPFTAWACVQLKPQV